MNKDENKNETKKTIKVKYKDPKKDSEAKTYELIIQDPEQEKEGRKFKNVRSNPFRTSFEIYTGGKDDTDKNDWTPKRTFGWATWVSGAVGILVLLVGIYFLFFRKKKNKKEEEAL